MFQDSKLTYKIFFFFLFIVANRTFLNGQDLGVYADYNYVIANDGLKLRSGPSTKYTSLLTIPFGTRVQYINEKSYNIDSTFINYNGEVNKCFGNWVKVKFNNTIGYVLDTYLFYKNEYSKRFDFGENKDYILIFPGCGCDDNNIYHLKEWHLFGYYFNDVNDYGAKKINMNYVRTNELTCDLLITTSKNEGLQFVIGYKKPISILNGSIALKEINNNYENAMNLFPKFGLQTPSFPGDLILEYKNKKQILSKKEFDYLTDIYLIADIDGDTKDDFIIGYGDKGNIKVLYLSSSAKGDQLVGIAAIFYMGYCC